MLGHAISHRGSCLIPMNFVKNCETEIFTMLLIVSNPYLLVDRQTDRQTERPTDLGIKAPSKSKLYNFPSWDIASLQTFLPDMHVFSLAKDLQEIF